MLKNKYLIVGFSGSGKSTLVDLYNQKHGTTQVLSFATRERRDTEKENATHTFVSMKEWDNATDVIASTLYAGNRYWATKKQLDDADFYVIDLKGAEDVLNHLEQFDYNIKVIFINVKKDILKQRLINRKEININERLDMITSEEIDKYYCISDYLIDNNNDIEDALSSLENIVRLDEVIIKKEMSKMK